MAKTVLKRRPQEIEETEENSSAENEAPAAAPPKKEFTKAEKKAMFAAYEKADAAWQKAKTELDKLATARSGTVQEILDKLGKGPFGYKGDTLTVIKRGDACYFRGRSERKVEEID